MLLSKAPATLDVYNDLDEGLVNFFTVLRDRPKKLVALLELTPYSRTEWSKCRKTWAKTKDPVERARRWYVVASQSFGGMVARDHGSTPTWSAAPRHPNGERHHGRGWGGERLGRMHLSRAASTANRVDHIWRFVERMRIVQIENLDWRACLERYDTASAVFYLDPPYVPATRRAGGYEHELSIEDHAELVERLLALEGVAVLSGYEHDVYEPLIAAGWRRREFGVWCTAAQRSPDRARDRRLEVVWASPGAAEPTLFEALAS